MDKKVGTMQRHHFLLSWFQRFADMVCIYTVLVQRELDKRLFDIRDKVPPSGSFFG